MRDLSSPSLPPLFLYFYKGVWEETLTVVATLYQDPHTQRFDSKEYKFELHIEGGRSPLGTITLDLARYTNIDGFTETIPFPFDNSPDPTAYLNVSFFISPLM